MCVGYNPFKIISFHTKVISLLLLFFFVFYLSFKNICVNKYFFFEFQ